MVIDGTRPPPLLLTVVAPRVHPRDLYRIEDGSAVRLAHFRLGYVGDFLVDGDFRIDYLFVCLAVGVESGAYPFLI